MGSFVVHVKAVGGHGCNRSVKNGEVIPKIEDQAHIDKCPDCLARQFVDKMREFNSMEQATFTHWPFPEGPTIVDDLLTHKRHGSFAGWKE